MRLTLRLSGLLLVVCTALLAPCCLALAQCNEHATLNEYELGAFVTARYGNRKLLAVHLLAAKGCSRALIHRLKASREDIRFFDEQVGYVFVLVPRARVFYVADLPGIAYASVSTDDSSYSNLYQRDSSFVAGADRHVAEVPSISVPFPGVDRVLPAGGPYFAAAEAGLNTLWQQHPLADGRGIRVVVFDGGIDFLHPALLAARDKTGKIVPKIRDVVTVTSPDLDAGWVQFGKPLQTVGKEFVAAGVRWIAPYEGRFRFGIFTRELHLGTWLFGESNPNIKSVPLSVGVLWDERANHVWVDTNGNHSFLDEHSLGNYGDTHQLAYFGRDDKSGDNRIPFGVTIGPARAAAYLSIADNPHGTMVAGALSANRETGGLFNGAAPNAQLIDARLPSRNYFVPLLLTALARPDVDIANWSGRLGVPEPDGRDDFVRHVVERAIDVYDKPIACFCGMPNALLVLDYQDPEMLRRNRQLLPPYAEVADGAVVLTPTGPIVSILAPSASLITQSRYMPIALPWEDGRLHITGSMLTPPSPAGYIIGNNPSPAIPVVSGVLADLISEARRTGVRYSAVRLKEAIMTGSHLLSGVAISKQGFGVVDALGAWNQLAKMATADDPRNPELTRFSVTREQDGKHNQVSGFQADLESSRSVMQDDLWITRHGGYRSGRPYVLKLRGNDGTFSLTRTHVILSRDKPARVQFSARVSSGVHVAFLQLTDATSNVVMGEVPLAIRAPDIPEVLEQGIDKYQASIPPLSIDVRYLRLHTGTQAARFVMRIPSDNPPPISIRSMPGYTYGLDSSQSSSFEGREPIDPRHHVGPMEQFESLVSINKPETLAVVWGNRGGPEYATPYDSPAPDINVKGQVVVAEYGVTIARHGQSIRVTNNRAEIAGRLELFDASITSSRVFGGGPHGSVETERTLPAKLGQWRILVSSRAAGSGNADAYVLNCVDSTRGCSVVMQRPLGRKGARLVIDQPQQGLWRIVIRSRDQRRLSTAYQIREAFLTDASAPIEVNDHSRVSGSSWSVALPRENGDAHYACFRIAVDPNSDKHKRGLRIAMTPLSPGLP